MRCPSGVVNRRSTQQVSLVVWVALLFGDPVVRLLADCKFESETDIAVAGYNALLYGFPDVQLAVEMTLNHVYLLGASV